MRVANAVDVQADLTERGALRGLTVGDLSVLQYPASELEDGLAALWVRRRDGSGSAFVSVFGQSAGGLVEPRVDGVAVTRRFHGLEVTACFRLGDTTRGWFWHVRVTNLGGAPVVVDVVHTQDIALAPYGSVRTNEYFVSQYLDLTPVEVAGHGTAVAVRQNLPGDAAPWALLGCLGVADRWATDATQVWAGDALRADLPAERRQGEHTLVALQTPSSTLAPGASMTTGFFGLVLDDHPEATSAADARHADTALADPAARPDLDPALGALGELGALGALGANGALGADPPATDGRSLFARAPELRPHDLSPELLERIAGADGWAHVETDGAAWLSGFADRETHVVSAAKERTVLRPHGHIMRTGSALTPDERSVTTTAWMRGGFHSQVTQGHVAVGSILSLRRSYLDLFRANGLRVFVARPDRPEDWLLLGMPSAWSVSPDHCRWWYRTEDGVIEVTSTAPADRHELGLAVRVVDGPAYRLLVTMQVSLGDDDGAAAQPPRLDRHDGGLVLSAPAGSTREGTYPGGTVALEWSDGATTVHRDELLFADGRSRDLPFVTLVTPSLRSWRLTIRPRLVPDAEGDDTPSPGIAGELFWTSVGSAVRLRLPPRPDTDDGDPAPQPNAVTEARRLDAILPWFAHDALVHYLSPRGLEQYTGGGWGTRDVSQGPVGLLLALGDHTALRDVVVRLLRAQQSRGDWPQAFDFYDRHRSWSVSDAHGDVIYWPLLAIGEYLAATGDTTLLGQPIPMVTADGPTAAVPLLDHLDRALDLIETSRIPGTRLPAYGHGDWNDSLQPADPALAAALCSTWTVTLQAQALGALAQGLDELASPEPRVAGVADRARTIAAEGVAAMRDHLLVDGVLAGYGRFEDGAVVEHLIHPRDHRTGLTYSLLPMIHAVAADLVTPDEARDHLELVRRHLTGPDGARLFDRPAAYHGGPMQVFQRAEASTFFGREIGIMYTHAHLRYAEALARVGDAPGLLAALARANPIGMLDRVAPARRRQATTYFSSSDAAFPDRAAADRDYELVRTADVALEGGWRVYSSGPGLYLRLVMECFLGVRRRGHAVEIDPVLPPALDGLTGTVRLFGRSVDVVYRVGRRGSGPVRISVGGRELEARRLENPYRTGGVSVEAEALRALLDSEGAHIDVEVS